MGCGASVDAAEQPFANSNDSDERSAIYRWLEGVEVGLGEFETAFEAVGADSLCNVASLTTCEREKLETLLTDAGCNLTVLRKINDEVDARMREQKEKQTAAAWAALGYEGEDPARIVQQHGSDSIVNFPGTEGGLESRTHVEEGIAVDVVATVFASGDLARSSPGSSSAPVCDANAAGKMDIGGHSNTMAESENSAGEAAQNNNGKDEMATTAHELEEDASLDGGDVRARAQQNEDCGVEVRAKHAEDGITFEQDVMTAVQEEEGMGRDVKGNIDEEDAGMISPDIMEVGDPEEVGYISDNPESLMSLGKATCDADSDVHEAMLYTRENGWYTCEESDEEDLIDGDVIGQLQTPSVHGH